MASEMMATQTPLECIEKAMNMVSALCQPKGSEGSRNWTMSIPARPDYDPDLIIADGLRAGREAVNERATLLSQVRQKDEALRAAIRAAELALFVIRKQNVMPNASWEAGFNSDLAAAKAATSVSHDGEFARPS